MKLFCVRHGETVYNLEGRVQGQFDSELSLLGRKQCEAVANALAGRPCDVVIASPLRRARETARYVADKLQVALEFEPRLMEINAGIFQGHIWHELAERFPHEFSQWRSNDPDYQIPHGESRRELMQRTSEALHEIRSAGHKNVMVVSHGGALASAFKALFGIPAEINPFELSNGSISTLHWRESEQIKLLGLNDVSHLHGLQSGGIDL